MPEELEELNYLLLICSFVNGKLSGTWKYAARILISSIVRRAIIDEVGFQVIIQKGLEESFLNNDNNAIVITPTGAVHLNYVQNNLRFSDEIKGQIAILRDLTEDARRIERINLLKEELAKAVNYANSRKLRISSDKIKINGFIGQADGNIVTFSITSSDYSKTSDFDAKGIVIRNLILDLKMNFAFCEEKLGYDKVTLFVSSYPDAIIDGLIKQYGFHYVQSPKSIKIVDLDQSLFEHLIIKILENHLSAQKLVKIGQESKFIDFSDNRIERVSAGQEVLPLKIFNGFILKVNKIKENKFLLWIDPTYMQFYTLDNWLEAQGVESQTEILNRLTSVDVLPNKRPGTLCELNTEQPISPYLLDFWKSKYNFKISKAKGVAKVRFDSSKPYDYPLETLCISRKWVEKNIGFMMFDSPVMSPEKRFENIQHWFNKYVKSQIAPFMLKITFAENMANLNDAADLFRESYEVVPPILVFSKNDLSRRGTDTRGIFKYGGYTGNKHISVFRVICPSDVSDQEVGEFLLAVKRIYDSLFGTLDFDMKNIRIPYPFALLKESQPKIEEIMRKKISTILSPKNLSSTSIAIIVNENQQHIFYYVLKSLINELWEIPDQQLRIRNFDRISSRELPLIRGFALQLYLKSLKPAEAPWILRYPSDGVAKTVYCGIGFSMHVTDAGIRKSIGVLAICDAQGKYIYQKHLLLSEASNYVTAEMLQKIFKFISGSALNITFERLVIYRKSDLKFEEKQTFERFLLGLKETDYWKLKKIDVITVEEDIYRLFDIRDNTVNNVNSGTILEFSRSQALICVSGHPETGLRHGTAKLMNIKAEICESSKTIYELAKEYYDRTFLNWMAPVTLSKYPPELNISQNIAEITKEVDITKEFSSLQV